MNCSSKNLARALFALAVVGAVASSSLAATPAKKPVKKTPETLVSVPASEMKWRELAGTGGIRVADMRGSVTDGGPYEGFVEFPAGKNNPHHFHTQALPTIVLSGVFYAVFDDGKKVQYPAGSYYYIPAKMPHLSGCEPGPNCVLFQYQNDNFDLVPTQTAK